MSKINRDADDPSPIADAVHKLIVSAPVLIIGVNRKANVGNYETVDVYAGIALPMPEAIDASPEVLREVVAEYAELGISIVAKETADRYTAIKNMMSGQA